MLNLKENPTLFDIQEYVKEFEKERGFTEHSILQECLFLGEEVGELFKAIRKTEGMKTDVNAFISKPDEELADIILYLCAIANRYNINLESALRNKEEINKKRTWG